MSATTYTERNYVRLVVLSLIVILMAACTSPDAQDSPTLPENTPVLSEQTPEIAADESSAGPATEPVEDAAAPEVEPPIPATIPLIIDSNGEIQNADRLPPEISNLAERVDEATQLLGDLLADVESEENGRPTYQQVAFLIVTGDSIEGALQWRLAATLTDEGRAAYPDHGQYTFYFSIDTDDGQESVGRVFAINRDLFGDFGDSLQLLTMALPATGPFTEASDDLSTHLIFNDTNGSQWVLSDLLAQHLLTQDLFVPLEPGAVAAYGTIPETGLGIAQNARNGAVYALSYEPDAVPQFVLEGSRWTAVQTWQVIDNALVGWNAVEWRFEPLEQMGLSLGEALQQFLADNPQAVIVVDPETGTATITSGETSHELVLGEGEEGEWVDIVTTPETPYQTIELETHTDLATITLKVPHGYNAELLQYERGVGRTPGIPPLPEGEVSAAWVAFLEDAISLINNRVDHPTENILVIYTNDAGPVSEAPTQDDRPSIREVKLQNLTDHVESIEFIYIVGDATVTDDNGNPIKPARGFALTGMQQIDQNTGSMIDPFAMTHNFTLFNPNTKALQVVQWISDKNFEESRNVSEMGQLVNTTHNLISSLTSGILEAAIIRDLLRGVDGLNPGARVYSHTYPKDSQVAQLIGRHFGRDSEGNSRILPEKNPIVVRFTASQ